MHSLNGKFLRQSISWSVLPLSLLLVGACATSGSSETSGDGDGDGDGDGAGGSTVGVGGTADPGAGGTVIGDGDLGTGGGASTPTCVQASSMSFLDFDSYDGENLSFLVAGMAVGGVYMGPWELHDEADAEPDPDPTYALEMVEGFGADGYALQMSDQESKVWGGGAGFWMSNCVDAANYSGIRLQVRGATPTGFVRIEVATRDTEAPSTDGSGACTGPDCQNAVTEFALDVDPEAWTQIDLFWGDFESGVGSGGVAAPLSGFGIVGLVFAINLQYDEVGPLPAPYELSVDEISFF